MTLGVHGASAKVMLMRCGDLLLKYEKSWWDKPSLFERRGADWKLVDCLSPSYLDAGAICVGSVAVPKWESVALSEERFSEFKKRCENGLSMLDFPYGNSQCDAYLKTGEMPTSIRVIKIEIRAKLTYDFLDKSITTVFKSWPSGEKTNVVKCTSP